MRGIAKHFVLLTHLFKLCAVVILFFRGTKQSLVGQGFTVTLRHTTVGRTPLDE